MIALPQMRAIFSAAGGGGGGSGPGDAWNPADLSTDGVLSNGDLTLAQGPTPSNAGAVRSVLSRSSGRYYFELRVDTHAPGSNNPYMGVVATSATVAINTVASTHGPFGTGYDLGAYINSPATSWWVYQNAAQAQVAEAVASGDVFGFALDFGLGLIWVHHNGTYPFSGDPPNGTGPGLNALTGTVNAFSTAVSPESVTARFTAADFDYPVPLGFLPWDGGIGGGSNLLADIPCAVDTAGVTLDAGPLASSGRGITIGSNSISGGYLVATGSALSNTTFRPLLPDEFAIKFTLNMPDVTTAQCFFDCRPISTNPGGMIMTVANGGFVVYDSTTTLVLDCQSLGALSANTDAEVVIQRKNIAGTLTLECYVNGVLLDSGTDNASYKGQSYMRLFGTSFTSAMCGSGSKMKDFEIRRDETIY